MGRIDIFDEYSLIDLPDNLPDALIQELKPVKVAGQQLRIRRWTQEAFEQQDQHEERRPRREEAPRESQREFRSRDEGGQGRMEQVVERALRDAEPPRAPRAEKPARQKPVQTGGVNMQTYRIEVGEADGATPRNIMGDSNEAGLDSSYIGRIELHEHFSIIELPGGMPKDLLKSGKSLDFRQADPDQSGRWRQPARRRAQPKRDKKRPK
jgi:ATP-dependent RNA helicase DeaD